MSAFVAILDRSGALLDPEQLDRLAAPLAPYGAEVASLCRGPVGIVLRHHGGAEACPRHGPLVDPETGIVVAVAGRFRVVGEARETVDLDRSLHGCAPAARALRALTPAASTADFLATLSGPFVLLAASPAGGWLEVARDHLGSAKAYYFLDRRWLIVASEPQAILAHPGVGDALDEGAITRFLGFRFGHGERSFFRQIRELPPAHRLRVTGEAAEVEQYWRFRRRRGSDQRAPAEVAAHFLGHLRRALADDAAGLPPERIGLSLSGGLDSTALAALAPRGVQAFSWTFADVPAGDERRNVEAVSRHLDLPVRWVPGDGLYPLAGDFAERFVDRGSPYVNPFSALKDRLYQAARAAGCARVLVGDGGDALYAAREYWLRDALAGGEPGAVGSLAVTARRAARGDCFARLALRRLLPLAGVRRALGQHPAPWLTAAGRAALPRETLSPILPPGRGAHRYDLAAGAKHGEIESEEQRLFARAGVERGNPFWSWPLLEMVLDLPAGWHHRDGRDKVLTREALRGHLPPAVLASAKGGLLDAFFLRGIALRRAELAESVFRHPRSDWQRYVRREWLEPYLSNTRSITFGHTILWRVVSYELWTRRLIRGRG